MKYQLGERVKLADKTYCDDGVGYIQTIKGDRVRVTDCRREPQIGGFRWGAWVKIGEFERFPERCGCTGRNGAEAFVGMYAKTVNPESICAGRVGIIRDFGPSHRGGGRVHVRISDDHHETKDGFGWSSWVEFDDLVVIGWENGANDGH